MLWWLRGRKAEGGRGQCKVDDIVRWTRSCRNGLAGPSDKQPRSQVEGGGALAPTLNIRHRER